MSLRVTQYHFEIPEEHAIELNDINAFYLLNAMEKENEDNMSWILWRIKHDNF